MKDGGTTSNMEGRCEYTELSSRGQPTRGGPPAWGLDKVLVTPHGKTVSCYELFTKKALDLD